MRKYDPWGRLLETTGSMANTLGRLNPFRYKGYLYDEETKYYYLRSRYYSPEWCRFINADALLGNAGGILTHNQYCYCCNSPISYADPDGMFLEGLIQGVKAAVGTVVSAVKKVAGRVASQVKKAVATAKVVQKTLNGRNALALASEDPAAFAKFCAEAFKAMPPDVGVEEAVKYLSYFTLPYEDAELEREVQLALTTTFWKNDDGYFNDDLFYGDGHYWLDPNKRKKALSVLEYEAKTSGPIELIQVPNAVGSLERNAKLSLVQLMLSNAQSPYLNDQGLAISVHGALSSAGRDSDITSGNTSLSAEDIRAIGGLLTDGRVYNYNSINVVGQALVDTARSFTLAAMFSYMPADSVIDKEPVPGYCDDWYYPPFFRPQEFSPKR